MALLDSQGSPKTDHYPARPRLDLHGGRTDSCHRAYCAMCDLAECPVRREPFSGRPLLTLEEAVQPDTPR